VLGINTHEVTLLCHTLHYSTERGIPGLESDLVIQSELEETYLHTEDGDADYRGEDR
jgi:hypothetical protein